MVTVASGSGTIELYTFSGTRASNAGDRNLPIHVAQLGLPPTRPGKDLRQFKTHTAPFVSKQTPGKPFETSRDSRIHVMELWYGDRAQKFNMFVHNSFLLSLIGIPRGQSDTEQLVNTKLWDEWGPNHTRFHAYVTPFQWLRCVLDVAVTMILLFMRETATSTDHVSSFLRFYLTPPETRFCLCSSISMCILGDREKTTTIPRAIRLFSTPTR